VAENGSISPQGVIQLVDSEEEGRSPTTDRRWLIEKCNLTIIWTTLVRPQVIFTIRSMTVRHIIQPNRKKGITEFTCVKVTMVTMVKIRLCGKQWAKLHNYSKLLTIQRPHPVFFQNWSNSGNFL